MNNPSVGTLALSLWRRWPDSELLRISHLLLATFRERIQKLIKEAKDPRTLSESAFNDLCRYLINASSRYDGNNIRSSSQQVTRDLPYLTALGPKGGSKLRWIQRVATALGMIMHFSVCPEHPELLIHNCQHIGYPILMLKNANTSVTQT